MAEAKLPYVTAYGNITKALEKIIPAKTPERFTQDYLSTKLGMPGGSAKPVIPFLKRTGFLNSDGSPTERYRRFRGNGTRGSAAAAGLREGYRALYELNEYAHDLDDSDVRDLIIQVTGSDDASTTIKSVLGSFRALDAYADFDAVEAGQASEDGIDEEELADDYDLSDELAGSSTGPRRLSLAYSINLHLPATSDVAVFNAIFKSLRENLLK